MTREQRIEIESRIDKMIGSREQQRSRTQSMSLEDRINSNNRYEKMRNSLLKIAEKHGIETLAITTIEYGRTNEGVTVSGRKFVWTGNNGMTERSRYCGDLYIEGVGTVFTSGTISKAIEYILKH